MTMMRSKRAIHGSRKFRQVTLLESGPLKPGSRRRKLMAPLNVKSLLIQVI